MLSRRGAVRHAAAAAHGPPFPDLLRPLCARTPLSRSGWPWSLTLTAADPHFAMPDDAADDNFTDWLHPNPTTGALTTYEGTGRAGYRTNLMIVRNAARKANTTFWNYFLCAPNSQPHASMGQTIGLSFSVHTRHSITLGLRVPHLVNVVTHTPTTDRLAVVGTGRCRSMTCRTHPRARCSGR